MSPPNIQAISKHKKDKHWEDFAQMSPYYAVCICEGFKGRSLSNQDHHEFFETGEKHIQMVLEVITTYLQKGFRPERCLDFGCGVGRLVVPLAKRFSEVVGVDVSQTMLDEAELNSHRFGLQNVTFALSDDSLSGVSGKFDFIHSYIVFQHIQRKRGEQILKRMIDLLAENGIAALHFTYAGDRTLSQRIRYWVHSSVPFAHRAANLIKGRDLKSPPVMINRYSLNRIFRILQEGGCEHSYLRFSNHAGLLGVIIFFQKRSVGIVL